jgi:hypothetical protein
MVFDRLFTDASPTSGTCPANEDHCKHLLVVDGSQNASRNTSSMPGLATNVFETWNRWQTGY